MALDATSGFGAIKLGAWQAFPEMQTADADPYAKSHRARAGRLLYGTAEGLVFTASDDDGKARLTANCTYRISGQTPPARLWTLFIAGNDGRPVEDAAGRPSTINSWVVLRKPDSTFNITVSSSAQAGNWLALPPSGNFRLVWTLLDSPAASNSGLIDLGMPKLEKIGCGNV
nr:DUF1214 domain-containing protein [Rhizobium sp. BK612]